MDQTVNNINNYYVINIFILIESKCNDRKSWQWLSERHAGGGQETMIQFVVALVLIIN